MTPTVAAGVEHAVAGPEEAPAVVFMHGIGGDWSNWLPQLDAFGDRYRCISWTMPGYGESAPTEPAAEPMTWPALADSLAVLLDHYDIERATLVGLSMGGMVAQQFAVDHPTRVDDLVLVATSPSFGRASSDFAEKYLASRYEPLDAGKTPADLAPGVVENLVGPDPAPGTAENCIASMSRITVPAYRRALVCLTTWAFDDQLHRIAARTLCVAGADDKTAPVASLQRLADGIAGADLEVIESCGHLVNLERPTEFNELLGAFLDAGVPSFWQRCVAAGAVPTSTPQPDAWAFGDSPELADELIALVLEGRKRATAGSVAEYEAEGERLPRVGDFEITLDGAGRPRAVLRLTDVRIGPLRSVDDQFAYDEGEGDRTRDSWLADHSRFFSRVLPPLGVEFDLDMATIFQRFDVVYQE